jgi:ABC-type cobalamin/Fe3+-siderophores transport system ATPase subunit
MQASGLTSNPFATRFVAPGQVDWVGPSDYLDNLVLRWQTLKCRACVVGAHGSGKSTLLEHFVPRIAEVVYRRNAEGKVLLDHDAQSEKQPTTAIWLQLRKATPQSMVIPWDQLQRGRLLILDGYEQLSLWRRAEMIARTNRRGVKLLVTSHKRTVLPVLCELSISPTTAREIVSQLTIEQSEFANLSDDELQKRLTTHGGNMREVLMELYDQFEEKRKRREC